MKTVLVGLAAGLLLTMGFLSTEAGARGRKQNRLKKGDWGGPHIRVSVNDSSATIEYDCAHGQINGPLVVDRRGRFDLKGTHAREHGGLIRVDEPDASQPARYTGWTDGKRMTLSVTLTGKRETVGTYNLTLGSPGRVFKCK